jgi:hypothetical protein
VDGAALEAGWNHDGSQHGSWPEESQQSSYKPTWNKTWRSAGGGRRIPNTFPPKFSAEVGETYSDWRRGLELWIAGEGGEPPEDVIGPRVLSALAGSAARICKRLRASHVGDEEGLQKTFDILEASPLITDIDADEGVAEQREFLGLVREAGESAEAFCARALVYREELLAMGEEYCCGEKFVLQQFLDAAMLDDADRALLISTAGNQMTVASIFRRFAALAI